MPSKLKLYPYKLGSASAKALATELGIKRVRADGRYHHFPSHLVINWGNSQVPNWFNPERPMLNCPHSVAIATNKLKTFNLLKAEGVSIPEFTTNIDEALQWLPEVVLARATLTGHSGAGISVHTEDLPTAPLYTKHVRHKREFRIHVFQGNVFDFTEKKKSSSAEQADQFVRSHHKGWVFCREGVEVPDCVLETAIDAVNALGLDFGAVDVGYREREDKAYVFEVNTAPGITGSTLTKYVEAFNGTLV